MLQNALAIRPYNYEAASALPLPKVAHCIPVLSSRYIGKCATRVLKRSENKDRLLLFCIWTYSIQQLFSFLSIIEIHGTTIIVSEDGVDLASCGSPNDHCRTIGFVLRHLTVNNGIIKLMKSEKSSNNQFFIETSFPMPRNITLLGFHGQATILSKSLLRPTYLFEGAESQTNEFFTLRVKNVNFNGMGIARFGKVPSFSNITFENCHFENVHADRDMIHLERDLNKFHINHVYFIHCTFINNVVNNFYTIIKIIDRHSVFNKCRFVNNISEGNGSLSLHGGTSILKSSYFKKNIALNGGAIYAATTECLSCSLQGINDDFCASAMFNSGMNIVIEQSSFEENSGKSGNGGGAIFLYDTSVCEISGSFFTHNRARTRGGAIYYSGKKLDIRTTWFKNNIAHDTNAVGGAISSQACDFSISNSSFITNQAEYEGGAIHNHQSKLDIVTSLFKYNIIKEGSGGAVFSCASKHFSISNSFFTANQAKLYGGAISTHIGTLSIKSSSFSRNSANLGGTIWFPPQGHALAIRSSSFMGNHATSGGTILFHGKRLYITSSKFYSNRALGPGAAGGALNLQRNGKIVISHCVFNGNLASFRGGAIMAGASSLTISSSSFQSSSYIHNKGYFGGEFIYSVSKTIVDTVFFTDNDTINGRNSLILHVNKPTFRWHILLKNGIHIKCLEGKNIEIFNQTAPLHSNEFQFLAVSCSFCPKNSYSLSAGHFDSLKRTDVEETQIKCTHCPSGGICNKGRIRPAENLWGYISGEQMHFHICPFGYCCLQKECRNYHSCHNGRSGTLCGNCKTGLTENLLNSDCLEHEKCKHSWFWLVTAVAGVAYLIVFMYINEVAKAVKVLLVPRVILNYSRSNNKSHFQMISSTIHGVILFIKQKFSHTRKVKYVYFTDDYFLKRLESTERSEDVQNETELLDFEEMQHEIQKGALSRKEDEVNLFPGLLKITIFFYQCNVLFKVYSGSKSHGFVHVLQEAVFTLFNLRVDGTFSQDLSWCPFDNLRPVSKAFLKSSFILYLFILALFTSILFRIVGRLKNERKEDNKITNNSRLFCFSLRLILISYAGITATCFSLISCVDLDSHQKVLFIDGSIRCYTWWQKIIIFVVLCWVAPFPIAIYASSRLLHNCLLSVRKFFICLLFPLPTICYWLYVRIWCLKIDKTRSIDSPMTNKITHEVLNVLEGPFRKSNCVKESGKYPLSWESILITRKLLLILIKVFAIDTFLRLFLMLVCTVLFLIHHIYMKPFSSNLLNSIETIFLTMLLLIGLLNILPAYNYIYPTYSYVEVQGIIKILGNIETILNLVFPLFVLLLVIILMSIRCFQFICLSCQCFVKIIRYCKRICPMLLHPLLSMNRFTVVAIVTSFLILFGLSFVIRSWY